MFVEIYIFHAREEIVIACFKNSKHLRHLLVKKKELGEKLVEKFARCLEESELSLKNVVSIYLSNSFSTWNASRLVTLFVKTLATFVDLELFVKYESLDKEDIEKEIKNFDSSKKNFKFINDPLSLEPLYKRCPNLNI